MDEINEHRTHEEHHDHEGSGFATLAIALIALLILGVLFWNFLPLRSDSSEINVDLNTPVPIVNDGVQTQ